MCKDGHPTTQALKKIIDRVQHTTYKKYKKNIVMLELFCFCLLQHHIHVKYKGLK